MTAHAHAWVPAEGVTARYRCDCGAWGRRPRIGGEIVAMKAPPWDAPAPASVRGAVNGRDAYAGGGGTWSRGGTHTPRRRGA